jgi:hypothetical protein
MAARSIQILIVRGEMATSRRRRWMFRIGLLAVLFIGMMLAGIPKEWIVLANHPRLQEFLQEMIPRLGDALIIAPLLSFVVEIAAAQELLDKFVANVSLHMIGYLLPMALRQYVIAYLTSSFVRKHWFIEYRIVRWPGQPDYLELTTMMQFELQNRSDSKQTYRYCYELAKSWVSIGQAKIAHIRATLDETKIFDSIEDDLSVCMSETDDSFAFEKPVEIGRQPHGTYKFMAESVECFPNHFSNAFYTRVPVLKTVVRVFFPEDYLDVNVHLSSGDDSVLTKTTLLGGVEWVVDCPMLPGQGFITRWKRTKNIPASPHTAQS